MLWDHLKHLYETDTAPGVGTRMIPKLKYEHVNLTPFSKMRVDLAAQASSDNKCSNNIFTCIHTNAHIHACINFVGSK